MPDNTGGPPEIKGPVELLKQLNAQPVSNILGVVGPSGAGGSKSRGEELWTFSVSFPAWRTVREPVRTEKLTLYKLATDQELDHFQLVFQPYQVVRFRARMAEKTSGAADALLVEIVDNCALDDELNGIAQKLQEPVTLESSDFGRFTLDRRVNWFTAETTWGSFSAKLNLSMDEAENPDSLLALARSLWELQPIWDQRIKDFAVAELLTLKNESWLEEDEKELTAEQFKQRMKLDSITVNPNGHFEFWFDDGDLFWGHLIMVEANLAEGPTDAGIHG